MVGTGLCRWSLMLFVDAVQVPHEALPLKPVPGKPGTYVRRFLRFGFAFVCRKSKPPAGIPAGGLGIKTLAMTYSRMA